MLRFKDYHFGFFFTLSEILFAFNQLTRCFKSELTHLFNFLMELLRYKRLVSSAEEMSFAKSYCLTKKKKKKILICDFTWVINSVYCIIFCHLIAHHLKKIFKQKETKLVLYWIMLRVIPLGLALLYRYYPLTF